MKRRCRPCECEALVSRRVRRRPAREKNGNHQAGGELCRVLSFLVGESSTIDSETGALSVFNVMNEAKLENSPVVLPKLFLVTCWLPTANKIRNGDEFQVTFNSACLTRRRTGRFAAAFKPSRDSNT